MQVLDHIEGYDSFEQVALGGMAAVYRARKISLNKMVAIKVLYPHLARNRSFIDRFQQEARSAARIQHDNIVNVMDCGEARGSHYIVMEFYDGLTLEELLASVPSIPVDVALSIVLNVCSGLEAAHTQNLVHRDVKPANIILTLQGGVKIADFGLAKTMDDFKLHTQHGKVMGTPAYMSPEQTRAEQVTTQSDIFSLGAVAYELLTSRMAFDGQTYAAVVSEVQKGEPEPIGILNPLVEVPIEKIMRKMIAPNLWDRYRHISEVLMDLEEAMDKYGLRRDRRTLREFVADPLTYRDEFLVEARKRIDAGIVAAGGRQASRENSERYYRARWYIDSRDAEACGALQSMGIVPGNYRREEVVPPKDDVPSPDTNAEYRVFLENIDRERESEESFALKLSMKIRTPLPRVRAVVRAMPRQISGNMPHEKAVRLVRLIQKLGGTARMEIVPGTGTDQPAPRKPASQDPVREKAKPEAAPRPVAARAARPRPQVSKSPSGVRKCPSCGWMELIDASFCSVCLHNFNRTEAIDVNVLRERQAVLEERIAVERTQMPLRIGYIEQVRSLPLRVKLVAGSVLLILLLLILFGR